jgi:hypothetical protein
MDVTPFSRKMAHILFPLSPDGNGITTLLPGVSAAI